MSDRTPQQAWDELAAGNRRVLRRQPRHPRDDAAWRRRLVGGQRPRAVVVGCSDSRAPLELIFDQGLGDLFVIRNAGQMVSESVLGSIEFAVSELHTPLLVVLGHTKCGAVAATIRAATEGVLPPGHLRVITDAVAPSLPRGLPADPDTVGATHIRHSMQLAMERSTVVAAAHRSGSLGVVAARYDIATGRVTPIEAHGVDIEQATGQ